jgi:membrane-associated PAP2 superfamily phosphatase
LSAPATLGPWRRADVALLALCLLLVLAWDLSGLDLTFSAWIGGARGFPWRNHVLPARVLHDGGRWASALALLVFIGALMTGRPQGASRRERAAALGAVLAGLLGVPLLKRFSSTSCPWDLVPFGGGVPYVGHWALGVADGGPGHCFPSGHGVAAWAFIGVALLWRPWRPQVARGLALAVLMAGVAFGWAQTVRGAHFVSHSLWTAWLCAALAVAAEPLMRPSAQRLGARG